MFVYSDMTEEINKLLRISSDEAMLLSYDTTFELRYFYMSILVAKHILFRIGKTVPVEFVFPMSLGERSRQ